eukprot:761539-Hanusia_phi.AAC.3
MISSKIAQQTYSFEFSEEFFASAHLSSLSPSRSLQAHLTSCLPLCLPPSLSSLPSSVSGQSPTLPSVLTPPRLHHPSPIYSPSCTTPTNPIYFRTAVPLVSAASPYTLTLNPGTPPCPFPHPTPSESSRSRISTTKAPPDLPLHNRTPTPTPTPHSYPSASRTPSYPSNAARLIPGGNYPGKLTHPLRRPHPPAPYLTPFVPGVVVSLITQPHPPLP